MAPLRLGSQSEPISLYLGTQTIDRVYLGGEQVWPTGVMGGAVILEYTANTGTEAYDLSAHGVAPFSIPVTAGYVIASEYIVIDTATVTSSVVVTDDNGDMITVDASGLVTGSITYDTPTNTATLEIGSDTSRSKSVSVTVTSSDPVYDGLVLNVDLSAVDAVPNGQAAFLSSPTVEHTDGNSNGDLDIGESVSKARNAIYIYPEANTDPAVTQQWYDQTGVLTGETSDTYISDGTEDTSVFLRVSDGTTNVDSSATLLPVTPLVIDRIASTSSYITESTGVTFSGLPDISGYDTIVYAVTRTGAGIGIDDLTVDGTSVAETGGGAWKETSTTITNHPHCALFRSAVPTVTGNQLAVVPSESAESPSARFNIVMYGITGAFAEFDELDVSGASPSGDVDVVKGGVHIALFVSQGSDTNAITGINNNLPLQGIVGTRVQCHAYEAVNTATTVLLSTVSQDTASYLLALSLQPA